MKHIKLYENFLNEKDMYFNGNGKIVSMDVDGRDVLVSPTGNYEEAIYAPLQYSIDIDLYRFAVL
jgi:hypothetical protein